MGAPILIARGARRAWIATLLAAVAVGCDPDPTGPGTVHYGPLRIRPVVESAVDPALLGLDRIAVTISRVDDGTVVADTVLDYDADPETVLGWVLGIEDLPTMVQVDVVVRRGATAMFSGSVEVEVVEAPPSAAATVQDAALPFVGPGANVTSLAVTPGDALLTFGESVQYAVTASEADGTEVPDAVVVWTSSDPSLAPIDADALLEAPNARGAVQVTAQTPTGVSASAGARFQPAASGLEVLAGDGATAVVGDVVPLEVRVIGGDGAGVEGVDVTFAAPAGAQVSDPTLTSGPDGSVATQGTLGTVSGAYAFTAAIAGAQAATMTVTATPGPPDALAFGAEPVTVGAGETLPAVTVELRDAFGNLATAAPTVTIALGTNPTGATLGGTKQVAAVNGVATFGDLSVDLPGSGYTLVATAMALPPAQSAPFDMRQVPIAVTVTPGQAQLAALQSTVTLGATAFDNMNAPITGQPFAWTTSDPTVVTVGPDGTVTAVGNGSATVTATAGQGGPSDAATIVVQQVAASVTVTPDVATLDAFDAQVQLGAVVADANGFPLDNQAVTWSSSAAAVATVNGTGLVTATGNGGATIQADAGPVTGSAAVTVQQAVTTIAVTPVVVSFDALDQQVQLGATGRDANGHVVNGIVFTWSTDDGAVALVDNTGNVTARGNGAATITAESGQAQATAGVVVQQVATALEVTPSAATLTALGANVTLAGVARDANGFAVPGITPQWTALDPQTAGVSPAGVVSAVFNGIARIEGTANGLADTATVTVAQVAATVTVTPAAATLDAFDATEQLSAQAFDANGFLVAGAAFTWSSDAPGVALVDAAGLATAKGNGGATITASTGPAAGTADLTVQQVPASIVVTPAFATLEAIQAQVALSATIKDANGFDVAGATPVWTSLATPVATVDAAGVVTAVANGTAPVAATLGPLADTASVDVQQVVTAVAVTPGAVLLTAIDEQAQFSAEPRDANGFAVPTAAIVWSSDDPTIAGIDAAGLVTAVANGATSARARAGVIEGFATVEVQQRVAALALTVNCPGGSAPPPAAGQFAAVVVITCDTLTALGDQALIEAAATDANGHPVLNPAITWTSLTPQVATVDLAGLVTAQANGTATIQAEADGVTAVIDVVIRQIAVSVTLQPPEVAIPVGGQFAFTATAFDANGFEVAGAVFNWLSEDPPTATVDPTGRVTGVAPGEVLIQAELDGATATAGVTVD